jgi:hypothetical protein
VAQAAAPPTFGPVTRVAELCSNDSDNPGSISPDGLTIYLESRRNGIDDRLWCATRPSLTSPFGPLSDSVFTNIRADPANDPASPVISADGLELFFAHSIGTGPQRIFRSVRADVNSAFGVGTEVASIQVGDITRPSWLSADGLRLYFHAVDRRWDLYVAERPSRASAFTAPTKTAIVNVNTYWGNQMEAVLTPDETQVFFSSDEGPGLGYRDIWWASRPDRYSQFGAPVNLTDINSGQDDTTPLWFGDGLFFASTRGTSGGWWQLEVFRAEVVPEPSSLVMLALAAAAGAGVALRRRKPYRQPDQTR